MKFDFKKILAFASKRVGIIVSVVVLLLALVVPFYPLAGMLDQYRSDLQAAESRASEVEGLLSKTRRLPNLDPTSTAEAPALETFPTERIIEAATTARDQLAKQSNSMVAAVEQLNRRSPLINSFPRPSGIDQFNFRDGVLATLQVRLPKIMRAVSPVTQDEIRREVERQVAELERTALRNPDGSLRPGIQQSMEFRRRQIEAEVPIELPKRRATESSVYIDPPTGSQVERAVSATFAPEERILSAQGAPDSMEMWFTQVRLWVQEDIAKAVAATNGNSQSVATSAVKRLQRIAFSGNEQLGFILPGQPTETGIPGMATDPAAAIPSQPAISFTGRVSNGTYDVIHVSIVAHVRTTDVARFAAEFPRQRLMTVLRLEVAPLVPATLIREGFDYGPDEVVEVKMDLEALLLRSWTDPLIPQTAKVRLGMVGAAPPQ